MANVHGCANCNHWLNQGSPSTGRCNVEAVKVTSNFDHCDKWIPKGCNDCEYTGYRWDTTYPCPKCALGEFRQYDQDQQELGYLIKRLSFIQSRIYDYEHTKD